MGWKGKARLDQAKLLKVEGSGSRRKKKNLLGNGLTKEALDY